MTVETATYIGSLNSALPTGADAKAEGDDHIRLLKSTILATFPGMTGAMTGTHTQLNKLVSTFSIASAPANSVYIDASGRVGIGVSVPSSYCDIRTGGSAEALRIIGGESFMSFFDTANGTRGAFISCGATGLTFASEAQGNNLIRFLTNGVERSRIDSIGNTITRMTSSAPALTDNLALVFSLASDTQLRISVRGSDGVTRTADIPLA